MTVLAGFHRLTFRFFLAILIVGSLVSNPSPVLSANGVVGTGSPASCTEAAFDTVFGAVQSSGGGEITFNCGAAPHTIIFSYQRAVSAPTVLNGGDLVTLSGGNSTSLFQVFSGQSLSLNRITLTRASGDFGALENFGSLNITDSQLTNNTASNSGGAVSNFGDLVLTKVLLSSNTAAQFGGGILTEGGTTTISNSQFTSNTGTLGGGGIAVSGTAVLTVSDSLFSGNRTTDTFAHGGAIQSMGTLTLTRAEFSQNSASRGGALSVLGGTADVSRSTFTGNWAAYGGALRQEGGELILTDSTLAGNGYFTNGSKVTTGGGALSWGSGSAALSNVTISGNWASYGGGLDHADGTTTLTNVTFDGNTAVGGGAIDQGGGSIDMTNVTIVGNAASFFAGGVANRSGTLTVKNTLLSGNINPDNNQHTNCYKPVVNSSFNLSSDNLCGFGTGRNNVNPLLGPLADNGGSTQTLLPQKGSPAIDGGTGAGCPQTDQRGTLRPQGQACDVGAVEVTVAELDPIIRVFVPLSLR